MDENAFVKACLAAIGSSAIVSVHRPERAASSSIATAVAQSAAAFRSRSAAGPGESASTAKVPATVASHHPARRQGTMLIVPGEAAGST